MDCSKLSNSNDDAGIKCITDVLCSLGKAEEYFLAEIDKIFDTNAESRSEFQQVDHCGSQCSDNVMPN